MRVGIVEGEPGIFPPGFAKPWRTIRDWWRRRRREEPAGPRDDGGDAQAGRS